MWASSELVVWVGRVVSIMLEECKSVSSGASPTAWEPEMTVCKDKFPLSTRHFLLWYDSFAWPSALARRFLPFEYVFLCLVKAPALSNDQPQRHTWQKLVESISVPDLTMNVLLILRYTSAGLLPLTYISIGDSIKLETKLIVGTISTTEFSAGFVCCMQ